MLVSVREQMHGLASALVVVARMIGMLVGISILTAVSLHIFYTTAAILPAPQALCPSSPLNCPAYEQGDHRRDRHRAATPSSSERGSAPLLAAVLAALFLRSRPAQLRPALP